MKRLWYRVRWWRWFLSGPSWPIKDLYFGPAYVDRESRRMMIERAEKEWSSREPKS